jgi:hypothetical protein
MVARLESVGVTLGPQTVHKIGELVNARGVSRSEAIPISLDTGLPLLKLVMALNAERALIILKHTQLALSFSVERPCPKDFNELINQALSNVRECHA